MPTLLDRLEIPELPILDPKSVFFTIPTFSNDLVMRGMARYAPYMAYVGGF